MEVITQNLPKKDSKKNLSINKKDPLEKSITNSWSKISPFWPLKNLIAVNPIAGFETLKFEKALQEAKAYFQQKSIPQEMEQINRESIKWLQAFFDEGQSTIQMPIRNQGLLKSLLSLIRFDPKLHRKDRKKIRWLKKLPQHPEALIIEALSYLKIPAHEHELLLTLMLTTLPGWAAHIQYRTNWADMQDSKHPHPVTQSEYLALRLVFTCLIWPEAKQLLGWHKTVLKNVDIRETYQKILNHETLYQKELCTQLEGASKPEKIVKTQAQLVFCIDVRSEPFRRALERQGNYETYGFAGFFGIPVSIENTVTGELHASCPVLLKPAHTIVEHPNSSYQSCKRGHNKIRGLKKLYQSLKYTFATPFSLVETLGMVSGLWMSLRCFTPRGATAIQTALKRVVAPHYSVTPDIQNIPFKQQTTYAIGALKMMGLTENFAPLVVFCGHGSTTQNNAYATALDCGACGGRHGAPNARILAEILNSNKVRDALKNQGIAIPKDTFFLGAKHNTTTDEVELYDEHIPKFLEESIKSLKQDLKGARNKNSFWRSQTMNINTSVKKAPQATTLRAQDWAQVRPEWGLARNASFIIGPRWLTKGIDLEGRSFLHSYEWEKDPDGSLLTTILTAPMVVAQWINAQYLFSTLDNVAFGGGSKITKNITGKIGIMQGNASDLMNGLPLQSVYQTDLEPYHQSMRLTVIVYAPQSHINPIIKKQSILQKLFGNGWIHLICYEPHPAHMFSLQTDLTWSK